MPLRRFSLIFCLLFLSNIAFAIFNGAQAEIKAKIDARLEQGFGRVVFDFERLPAYSNTLSETIFVLSFNEPVKASLKKVVAQLPRYIGVARIDPDGRAVRFALLTKYKVNLMAAGNKLFIDFLPTSWVGLPPPLPESVIAELARKAAEAEEKKKLEARQRAQSKKKYKLDIHLARHKTFSRIVFSWSQFVTATLSRDENNVLLVFGHEVDADLTRLKVEPPPYLRKIEQIIHQDGMAFMMDIHPEAKVRGFREGDSYVVDITGPKADVDLAIERMNKKVMSQAAAMKKEQKEKALKKARQEEVVLAGKNNASRNKKNNNKAKPKKGWVVTTKKAQFQPDQMDPDKLGDVAEQKKADEEQKKPLQLKPVRTIGAGEAEQQKTNNEWTVVEKAAQKTVKKAASKSPPKSTENSAQQLDNSSAPAKAPQKTATKKIAPLVASQNKQKNDPQRVNVMVDNADNNFKLIFGFNEAVPAAIFRRASTIWIVFDTDKPIDLAALKAGKQDVVELLDHRRASGVQVLRFKLKKPWLTYAAHKDNKWIVSVGDLIVSNAKRLNLKRDLQGRRQSIVKIDLKNAGRVHWLVDQKIGDRLAVVTAKAPERNLSKRQRFVEFQTLTTAHGVVIKPLSDDLAVRLQLDEVLITRGDGLTLSAGAAHQYKPGKKSLDRENNKRVGFIDFKRWQQGGVRRFASRAGELERAIAASSDKQRNIIRLELARLFLSHQLAPEALAVTKQIAQNDPSANADPSLNILRGVAATLMKRLKAARKDLGVHALVHDEDAALWRGIIDVEEKKWKSALKNFAEGADVISSYPFELQALFRVNAAYAALQAHSLGRAADELDAIPAVKLSKRLRSKVDYLRGRYLEQIGRREEAIDSYDNAIASNDRENAAKAQLRKTALLLKTGKLARPKAIKELEKLSILWRGDDTELKVLRHLAKLYVADGKYRQSFQIMKNAVQSFPKAQLAVQIQDEMKEVFRDLFLHGKGDRLPPITALSLYYDYRELTPIGRLGDEMIRRLADRLISIDLLDQAAELLDYQVKNRLSGPARAQVATRLAMVHLMNRKPILALSSIRQTRQPDLPKDLRRSRDILEARALGEMGRVEGAIDLLSRLSGDDVERLRADALWNAQKWKKAGMQLERMMGARWSKGGELKDIERFDVLRAAISYALADDQFALNRLAKKYYPKMLKSSDAEAFVLVTKSIQNKRGKAFKRLVKDIASVDTLDAFMKSFRNRNKAIRNSDTQNGAKPAKGA